MHRVVWSDEATDHLTGIKDYIAQFDPAAAANTADRLERLATTLTIFPERGRPGSGGTREIVSVRPYIMQYVVEPDLVIIVSVRHSARRPLD